MTPAEFKRKWARFTGKESAAYQEHFGDLCRLLRQPTPAEPSRPKEDFPWFWTWDEQTTDFTGGTVFDGNRWNDCHYTTEFKRAACAARKGVQTA